MDICNDDGRDAETFSSQSLLRNFLSESRPITSTIQYEPTICSEYLLDLFFFFVFLNLVLVSRNENWFANRRINSHFCDLFFSVRVSILSLLAKWYLANCCDRICSIRHRKINIYSNSIAVPKICLFKSLFVYSFVCETISLIVQTPHISFNHCFFNCVEANKWNVAFDIPTNKWLKTLLDLKTKKQWNKLSKVFDLIFFFRMFLCELFRFAKLKTKMVGRDEIKSHNGNNNNNNNETKNKATRFLFTIY